MASVDSTAGREEVLAVVRVARAMVVLPGVGIIVSTGGMDEATNTDAG